MARRLANPAHVVALAELPARWFHSLILVRCRNAAGIAADPAVPGKMRGAWGRQLGVTASAEALADQPCRWRPPCAYDVFFRSQGSMTGGLEIPKPCVPALFADGPDLWIRLTLFGFATDWTEVAAEALVRACRDKLSLPLSLNVIDRQYWSEEIVSVSEAPEAVVLAFATPLKIRRRQSSHVLASPTTNRGADFVAIITSLANRVSGLARWQDARLEADFRALKVRASTLTVRPLTSLPKKWQRFSRRQQQWIPMAGWQQIVLVEGEVAPLMPLLAIGETTHVGSHTSLGMGRYAILMPG